MNIMFNNSNLKEVKFFSEEKLTQEEAKEYAKEQLHRGNYKNCTIGKVYVNNILVDENVKIP